MPETTSRTHPAVPEVIAHRGVPGERPESSLAGFELALRQGAVGIELDVHLTSDGRIVVHHDARLAGPEGAGSGPAIRAHPLRQLRSAALTELPELAEVVDLVRGRATLHVELKGIGVAGPTARLLAAFAGSFTVHSFDHRAVLEVAGIAPELPRGVLMVARAMDPAAVIRAADARTLWQEAAFVDAELVRQVHGAGCRLVAWTVNDADVALGLAAIGVDGICTDRPAAIRAALAGAD